MVGLTGNGWRRTLRYFLRTPSVLRCRGCVLLAGASMLAFYWMGYFASDPPAPLTRNHHVPYHSANAAVGRQFMLPTSHSVVSADSGRPNLERSPSHPTPLQLMVPNTTVNSPPSAAVETWSVVPPDAPCQPEETLRQRRSGDDGRWFDFSVRPLIQFYVLSAIWDDRESTGFDRPVVRVISLSTTKTAGIFQTSPVPLEYGVRCRYHMPDGRWLDPVRALPLALPIGYGWWVNSRMVRELIYDCPAPNSTLGGRPDGVTMLVSSSQSGDEGDRARTACIPVEYPDKPSVKDDFVVCVQVTYGSLDALRLIEWMELQRMLGVGRVGVYNLSIDEGPGAQVLRYYTKTGGALNGEGLVELRRSDYIADGPMQYLLHGSPVINDCIYRNMHRFRHVVVVDFDEFIVPQSPWLTLKDAVEELERMYSSRSNPPVNYIFPNNYFFTDFTPAPLPTADPVALQARTPSADDVVRAQLASRLVTLKYRYRAPPSMFGYAVKSIVDPQACRQMHNHYCWDVTPAYQARGYVEVVPDTVAVNHHYKPCHFNATQCANALKLATVDSVTMGRHWQRLVDNVAERILQIFGISASEFLAQLKR